MKKGLFNVFLANLFFLIISLLINILIPKYVSVDTYSLIKTYTLYLSYAGFFSIGYNDGMYLKYGGMDIKKINKKDLSDNMVNFLLLIFLMFVAVLLISLIIKNQILTAFSFGMMTFNIIGYLKSLYQATGKYKLYGIILNIEKVIVFILSIFAIFFLKSDNYLVYIYIQVFVGIIISIILLINLELKLHFIKKGRIKIHVYIENIKSGIILMLGNISSQIFTSMDRFFVKFLLSTYDFAMYSFAASMEVIINILISPITITMYNYFCKNKEINDILKIKKLTLFYGFIIISLAFPAKFILEIYLKKYILANQIIFLLFGCQLFYIIIKGIYVNLYKAKKNQMLYLKQMIIMIVIGFILNIILYSIFKNNFGIALATYITSIIWFITCEILDKEYRFNYNEYVTIIIISVLYLICGFFLNSVIGFFLYIIGIIIISLLFNNSIFKLLSVYFHMSSFIKNIKKI